MFARVDGIDRLLSPPPAQPLAKINLSQAQFEHGDVDIELNVMHGGVKITLPRDAVVDFDAVHTEWKDTRYKPARNSTGNGPRVRITGVMGFGRLKIQHARP